MKFSVPALVLFVSAASAQKLRTTSTTLETEKTAVKVEAEPVKVEAEPVKLQADIKESEPILISEPRPIGGGTADGDSCGCQSDYDCNKPTCEFNPYTNQGTCVAGGSFPAGSPTLPPTPPPNDCCVDPKSIPSKCEVEILIKLLDHAIAGEHRLAAQAVRLAFHDAGTFNKETGEGGANGCLMTDPDMREQPENGFLDLPLNTLEVIKTIWEGQTETCVSISAADMIQFVGHVAAVRQVHPLGMNPDKIATLMEFEWGRPDETNCDIHWCDNLPGFSLGSPGGNVAMRCLNAGREIKTKMMERNGFTAEESCALIGAHTIGLTRNSFGPGLSGPWVENGSDNATKDGPVFDNGFHDFLTNTLVANSVYQFVRNVSPFADNPEHVFEDWYRHDAGNIQHLDTDIVLAFPSQDTDVHPDFHTYTNAFTNDNFLFLSTFFAAFKKMAALGVTDKLSTPGPCEGPCNTEEVDISVSVLSRLVADMGAAKASADNKLLEIQQREAITAVREASTTVLHEAEILDPDSALEEVAVIQAARVEEKEELIDDAVREEEALKLEKQSLMEKQELVLEAEMIQKREESADRGLARN